MANSIYSTNKPEHEIQAELNATHELIMMQHQLEQEAIADNAKAKILESYFRGFKMAMKQVDSAPPSVFNNLEQQAIMDIISATNVALKFSGDSGALFRRSHSQFMGSRSRGGDDIFEAEFSTLLNTILEQAKIDNTTIDIQQQGASLIGDLPANISKNILNKISQSSEQIKKMMIKNKPILLEEPVARAAKVDVQGYSTSINISTQIKPEWREFIRLIQGTNFTLKNYSSRSQTEALHLGNTNLYKASLGVLTDVLPEDEGLHVFFHSLYHAEDLNVMSHIQHWRLIYELAGKGLYTIGDNGEEIRLNEANFIVYNDPASDNIFVRSTKQIIVDALSPEFQALSVGANITSPIILVKNYFN